ncbi:HAD hydrolase family protein [Acinetobacter haemolyticus]|uniref:HAD hydrolase family protein n=1 Tax=Acinetobacter haemolyticus TaxID=29430 RepID=UPI000DE878C6|nr:HAD hydrolase family protein [Acinetobacter haemolyticus]WHR57143.1 HAD hydrolase family protein [Acinetobacter haemolyticus]
MKRLIFDIDDTICNTKNGDYKNATPNLPVIDKIKEYHKQGFEICFYTSRNVRTFQNNIGKINAHTLPIIIEWLNKYSVPYDEIITGKPWCGFEGFYIDDKAIRPTEFVNLSYEEICELITNNEGNS